VRDGQDRLGLPEPDLHLGLKPGVLAKEPAPLPDPPHDRVEPAWIDRLEDVTGGPAFHRLDGGVKAGCSGHADNVGRRRELLHLLHHPVAVHVRELEIEQQQPYAPFPHDCQPVGSGVRGDHLIAAPLEELGQESHDLVIVVQDQNAFGIHRLVPLR